MLDVIETHYAEAVTLQTLSATVGRQPAYLGRLFRQEVGATVRDHLTRVRLDHAAALVREGTKIEAVALSVGYRSKKNFYQQFKKRYGMTPVPYRSRGALPRSGEHREFAGTREPPATASAADGPRSALARYEGQKGAEPQHIAEPEPLVGKLGSIIRASNRAWRLAIRAQELIAQHFARLRVGTLLTNEAGRYVGANNAAFAVTGYSPLELYDLSPSELFESAPRVDMRCVWQFLLSRPPRPEKPPNAMVRTKGGDLVGVHLVTLRNVLWGRHEMATMLEGLPSGVA